MLLSDELVIQKNYHYMSGACFKEEIIYLKIALE